MICSARGSPPLSRWVQLEHVACNFILKGLLTILCLMSYVAIDAATAMPEFVVPCGARQPWCPVVLCECAKEMVEE